MDKIFISDVRFSCIIASLVNDTLCPKKRIQINPDKSQIVIEIKSWVEQWKLNIASSFFRGINMAQEKGA